jgi:hypothetical protein
MPKYLSEEEVKKLGLEDSGPSGGGGYLSGSQAQALGLEGPVLAGLGAGKATGIRSRSPWKENISQAYHAALGTGGALLGAAAAAPGIATTGAGGALGYGAGTSLARQLDEWTGLRAPRSLKEHAIETGTDVGIGLATEGVGAAVPAVAYGAKKAARKGLEALGKTWPSVESLQKNAKTVFSRSQLSKEAGERLLRATSSHPMYERNIAESKAVEEAIPGLKFTGAQRSFDPLQVAQERTLTRAYSPAKEKFVEQRTGANEAIQNYYRSKFPEQPGLGEALSKARAGEQAAEQQLAQAATARDVAREAIEPARGVQDVGKEIREKTYNIYQGVRKRVSDQWQALPNVPMKPQKTASEIASINKEMKTAGTDPAHWPTALMERIGGRIGKKSKPLGFQELRGFHSQVKEDVRAAGKAGDFQLQRNLERLAGALDADMQEGAKQYGGDIYKQYQKARVDYLDYHRKWRTGPVGDILKRADTPTGWKVADSDVAGQFFRSKRVEDADAFINTLGGNEGARRAVKDYAAADLLASGAINPGTGELNAKPLYRWLQKNQPILARFNLTDDFSKLGNAQKALEAAQKNFHDVSKSAASRMLNVDSERAMAEAFSGVRRKSTEEVAQGLMARMEGDPVAEAGLRNAFADWIFGKAQKDFVDQAGNKLVNSRAYAKQLGEYMPAIREFWKKEPEKIQALVNVNRAYQRLGRNVSSPLGGGSDTAENLMTALAEEVAPVTGFTYRYLLAIRTVAKKLDKVTQGHINDYLSRAMVDPDYADTLKGLALAARNKKEETISQYLNRANTQTKRLMLYGSVETVRRWPEEEEEE